MKIYYSKFYPALHFIFAIVLIVLIMIAKKVASRVPEYYEIAFILVLIVRGFLFILIPYFEINKDEIVLLNRFGGVQKRYLFQDFSDFDFEGNQLYLKTGDKSKKVRISKMFVPQNKWDQWVSFMKQNDLTKELH